MIGAEAGAGGARSASECGSQVLSDPNQPQHAGDAGLVLRLPPAARGARGRQCRRRRRRARRRSPRAHRGPAIAAAGPRRHGVKERAAGEGVCRSKTAREAPASCARRANSSASNWNDRQRSPSPWACEHSKVWPGADQHERAGRQQRRAMLAAAHERARQHQRHRRPRTGAPRRGGRAARSVHTTSATRHPAPAAIGLSRVAPAAPVRALAESAAASGSAAQQRSALAAVGPASERRVCLREVTSIGLICYLTT